MKTSITMSRIILAYIVLALCAITATPSHARGHANAWFGKVSHTTKATRAASAGQHIAALVAGASHATSAHSTHTKGNHGHKSTH